jgi:ketosteroid isomerase-like protein
MSSEVNKQIALNLLEALNVRDLSLWSRHLAEDWLAENPGVSVPLDKTRSMGYQQRFVTALPDIHFEVLHVLAEGDHVLSLKGLRLSARGCCTLSCVGHLTATTVRVGAPISGVMLALPFLKADIDEA